PASAVAILASAFTGSIADILGTATPANAAACCTDVPATSQEGSSSASDTGASLPSETANPSPSEGYDSAPRSGALHPEAAPAPWPPAAVSANIARMAANPPPLSGAFAPDGALSATFSWDKMAEIST